MPGLVIFFFGLGALVTALTTSLSITVSLNSQLVVFIITSTLALLLFRKLIKKKFMGRSEMPDSDNYNIEIGKIVSVIELIEPSEVGGKVRYLGLSTKKALLDYLQQICLFMETGTQMLYRNLCLCKVSGLKRIT